MSETNTAGAVLESAPPADGETSKVSGAAAQPSSPPASTETTSPASQTSPAPAAAEPAAKTEDVPENYVWQGDPDDLPKSLQNRGMGVLRYLTKQTQMMGEEKKLAEEYRKLQSDPVFTQFMQAKTHPNTAPVQPSAQAPLYTREELEEAQVNPEKLGEIINRVSAAKVRQAEEQVGGVLSQLQTRQAFIDRKQELQDFAELHPDFWDLNDRGLMKPFIREIVDTGQGTILDAYSKAKEVREKFRQEARQEAHGLVQTKKAAFTAPPTPSNEPEIIWASDKNEATKLAFENALQGKKVQVRVKH